MKGSMNGFSRNLGTDNWKLSVPRSGNSLIPDIGRKIARVLQLLKLKPAVTPQAFLKKVGATKHRYFSAAQTTDGQTVAFYARLHDNPDAGKKFLTEIAVLKKFATHRLPFTDLTPKFFSSGRQPDFEWFTREYVTGPSLGHSRHLTGRLSGTIMSQLAHGIASIAQCSPRHLRLKLPAFNPRNYAIAQQCWGLTQNTRVPPATCRSLTTLVNRSRPLLVAENRALAHGDLNLGNILVPRGRVRIVDWELTHVNNFAYDIGYLWVHLWEAPPRFRQQLVATYLQQVPARRHRRFQQLFPVVVAYLAIGGIPYRLRREVSKAEQQQRQRYHIALLNNCLQGFHKLTAT